MVDYIYAWKFHIDKGQTENKDETAENPAGEFLVIPSSYYLFNG